MTVIRGPHDAQVGTPARVPGSIRRTTTIDSVRTAGFDGPSFVDARARDLRTDADGGGIIVGEATITARLDGFFHVLATIETSPAAPALQELIGVHVGPGFRNRVDALMPGAGDTGSLLYLLLDDMPGAALVSGYSMLKAGMIPERPPDAKDEFLDARSDLCAGWAADGYMMTEIRTTGRNPVPYGPVAPDLWGPDELALHAVEPMPALGMRRLRRVDVLPAREDGLHPVDAFFRDTHSDPAGEETVVHEYRVTATVDPVTRTVVSVSAGADVLPWAECPGALVSAARVAGRPLAELRPWVRANFKGTTTCTHLNDTLRGLADVGALLDRLSG